MGHSGGSVATSPGAGAARWRSLARLLGVVMSFGAALAAGPPARAAQASTVPFPESPISAEWISPRYQSGEEQTGDILPISWSRNGTFAMVNDGSVQGRAGRNVLAKVLGSPPQVSFRLIGRPDQFGHVYSNGFTAVDGVFYATRVRIWHWWTDSHFNGLWGIAYSLNRGHSWRFPSRKFPWWTGDVNFVQTGQETPDPDGQIYAIANGREFNANYIWLGSTRPGPANVTNPRRWRWRALPIVSWPAHITYPRMTYDPQLRRFLLSFSYSYEDVIPHIWTGGAQLVVLEAPSPEGPFRIVFQQSDWGPSNGYGGTFPIAWQGPLEPGPNGTLRQNLWMEWAANYIGCVMGLDCSGKYGMNMQELQLRIPAAYLNYTG